MQDESFSPMREAHLIGMHKKQMCFECLLCRETVAIFERQLKQAGPYVVPAVVLNELNEIVEKLMSGREMICMTDFNEGTDRLVALVERLEENG